MSPEQADGKKVDTRSDVFSFGSVLYEMLVGHVPFTGPSSTAIMMKHLQQPPPSVLDERTDVPAAVGKVVSRAMEKVPANRYQTVGELVEDFTIASGMEIAATPSGHNTRVVVPTKSASQELTDERDEETLVRRRVTTPMARPPQPAPMPPPTAGFNPWKILIPSMVGLLVIFGVIYAFTRNSKSTTETTPASTLAADPNGQPVEAASPPTGAAESGIPVGGGTNPTEKPSASPEASPLASPTAEDLNNPGGVNTNANDNANTNSNSKKAPAVPVPSPKLEVEQVPPSSVPAKAPIAKPTLPPPSPPPATLP